MNNNTNKAIFKNMFNKKNEEENVKEISGVKTIKQNFNKIYEDIKTMVTPFESLPLIKKVEVFLKRINISSGELKNIYQRIRFIINNNEREFEEYHIHVFLNENINVDDDKKLDLLNDFINERCSKLLDVIEEPNGHKFTVMFKILGKYGIEGDAEMTDLLGNIMSSCDYDKIVGLYNFILDNNARGSLNANAIKEEMKIILEEISKSKKLQNI